MFQLVGWAEICCLNEAIDIKMKQRTYIDLNLFPELYAIPYDSEREPEAAYSAMLRQIWVNYARAFWEIPTSVQENIIRRIKKYDGSELEAKIDDSNWAKPFSIGDWRPLLLFISMETIKWNGSRHYGVDIWEYNWEHARLALNIMSYFMKKNVGLLEHINNAKEIAGRLEYRAGEFDLSYSPSVG